jgi:hypothetical protein
MEVLFPSEMFESKAVDAAFGAERLAAQDAGIETHLIDAEALDAGSFDKAVRRLPEADEKQLVIYRGWMMSAASYGSLHGALARRGLILINDAEAFRHTHHLPESYPIIRGHTPRTVWTTTGPSARCENRRARARAPRTGPHPAPSKTKPRSRLSLPR